MHLELINISRFTGKQYYVQHLNCSFLMLTLSGLEYGRLYAPGGTLTEKVSNGSLQLVPPGFRYEFSFNEKRENYTALCCLPEVTWNGTLLRQEFSDGNRTISLALSRELTPEQQKEFKQRFQQAAAAASQPLPAQRFAAELILAGIVAELALPQIPQKEELPAAVDACRQAFAQDRRFQRTFREIAQEIGLSQVHLRRLFLRFCQTDPGEYRAQLRFRYVTELLRDTDLALKEVADAAGMRNVTHLHAFVKKHSGLTPAKLRRNLRG